jgi:predicted RNA-binding protein with PUA-like domain
MILCYTLNMSTYLLKSEPSEYSITDLERDGASIWYGVRNYLARNTMRDLMRSGDTVLFYHSSCKVPGIYGIARVISPIEECLAALESEELLMWRDFVNESHKTSVSSSKVPSKTAQSSTKLIQPLQSDLSVAFPDFTQFDPNSKYFDPKSTIAKPIWYCVMVQFEQVLETPITLADLRNTQELSTLQILTPGNRLSITRVSEYESEMIYKKFPL